MKHFLFSLPFIFLPPRPSKAKNETIESIPAGIELKVDEFDVKIIQGATKILSHQDKWNKKDNRQCPNKA